MIYKLVKPAIIYEKEYNEYIAEWEISSERIVPQCSRRDGENYVDLINKWDDEETEQLCNKGLVPATLYFLVDENKKIYGALQIRHYLNEYLLHYGGHIGYGIRYSERGNGLAAEMLALSLPIAQRLGLDRILITCFKTNIASAKTIIKNGGILENEVVENGEIKQRYWIDLKL